MLDELKQWLNQEIKDYPEAHFILAVSGGIDSAVMAELFYQLKVKFSIAHCNFNLRGKESDKDQIFVEQLGKKLRTKVYVKQFKTQEYATETRQSIQEAARNLRYQWFEELRSELQADFVVIGTHKSDETETVLINLMRGSGIAGIHGVYPIRGPIIRPLMLFTRDDIESFSRNNKLKWRNDSSNDSSKYLRNKLRNEIIPELKKINPDLDNRLAKNTAQIREVEQIVEEEFLKLKPILINKKKHYWEVNKHVLKDQTHPHLHLYHFLKEYGYSIQQCIDVFSNIEGQTGAIYSAGQFDLLNDRHHLLLARRQSQSNVSYQIEKETTSLTELGLRFEIEDSSNSVLTPSSNVAMLDCSKLQFPLSVRPWKEGDKMKPLGMKGSKKVSDILIDAKVPLILKPFYHVVESGGDIAWLIGLRISEKFKLTDESKSTYTITQL